MLERFIKRLNDEIRPIMSYDEGELKKRFNMFLTAVGMIQGGKVMLYITPNGNNNSSACKAYYIYNHDCIIKMEDATSGELLGTMHFPVKDDSQIFYDLMFEDIMDNKEIIIEITYDYEGDEDTLLFLWAKDK